MSENRRLFVCTNQKSGVGEDVAKALKKELKHQNLKKQVVDGQKVRTQVQTCDCLDLCKGCKKGPGAALIVYPEGTVYGNVRPADAAELVAEHLGRGKVLKRLRWDE
ncbi:(2Fe-2S) ferredoxin domain-containing protein [Hymenobacter sp. 5317J-9]|uniref:(2Fe-2S) ferredoxin domain-containing protein n=1 Tax=Hymenobacter sp. 5317J-9 TaxID=2932250 RepID=UPI001FD692AA|nr:(2Fe-2S) ferredoxin domain-containing protein [Hymenobacter sp. 5317J-9]UOQ97431.1 (2Fe-2S) ferredoxin domain-containing protein [Hymenobacter sp. 5317J-9]